MLPGHRERENCDAGQIVGKASIWQPQDVGLREADGRVRRDQSGSEPADLLRLKRGGGSVGARLGPERSQIHFLRRIGQLRASRGSTKIGGEDFVDSGRAKVPREHQTVKSQAREA